jgi:hypothetical protein
MMRFAVWIIAIAVAGSLGFGSAPAKADTIPSICDAIPGNLVQNCGFETESFPPHWSVTPASDGSALSIGGNSNSGVWAAQFGAFGGTDDIISQVIPTVAGRSYALTFYWQGDPGSDPELGGDSYFAQWDGGTIVDVSNNFANGYIQYSFPVTGTGSDTITFGGQDAGGSYVQLDDISLVAVATPEPATLLLVGAGLTGLGMVRRRRR